MCIRDRYGTVETYDTRGCEEEIMKTTRSEKLFKEACELIPGGVNSPVRACLGVGADPLFIASAKGLFIYMSQMQIKIIV